MNASLGTPTDRFFHWERTAPDKVYLRQPTGPGNYRDYTWREVGQQVRQMASALQALGLKPGDKIAIAARNSAHWVMADQAITAGGFVSVGIYPKQATDAVQHVLSHSEARAIFVGPILGLDGIMAGVPDDMLTIGFPYEGAPETTHQWDDLIARHEPLEGTPSPAPEDLWTLVYTSGTTGLPKGVALSHEASAFAANGATEAFDLQPDEVFFSYLPLAHIAERGIVEGMSLYSGGTICFLQEIDRFAEQLAEVAPTRFFAVPVVWNKLRAGILAKLPQHRLDRVLRVPILGRMIAARIRKALGLHRVRQAISGAAPLPADIQTWFQRLGIDILQGYGMSENLAYATATRIGRLKPGSVGEAMPGCEIRIDEKGEILTRGPATMMGYYKDPEKTQETLVDGWLHTGDKGHLDEDGHLFITGRVKEIFKTLKGKYVAPAPIEMAFGSNPTIDLMCVMGSGMKQPFAMVLLDETVRDGWPELSAGLLQTMEAVNKGLEAHERLSHLFVVSDEWSPDTGMVTPTLKVRRERVESRYLSVVEPLLAGEPVQKLEPVPE